jgi:hypothetical protein
MEVAAVEEVVTSKPDPVVLVAGRFENAYGSAEQIYAGQKTDGTNGG